MITVECRCIQNIFERDTEVSMTKATRGCMTMVTNFIIRTCYTMANVDCIFSLDLQGPRHFANVQSTRR